MRRRVPVPALALALALLVPPFGPAPSSAVAAPTPPRGAATVEPASQGGVYLAIGCGLGIKLVLAGGFANPILIGIAAVPCALMIVDALATPD